MSQVYHECILRILQRKAKESKIRKADKQVRVQNTPSQPRLHDTYTGAYDGRGSCKRDRQQSYLSTFWSSIQVN